MAALSLPYLLPRVDNADLEFRKYWNFLLSLLERRRNEPVLESRPFEVTIDPSTICQLQCPYCEVGNGAIRRGRALLSPITHRRYIDGLADEMFVAWYFSTGEPLINRRFAEIVAAARGRGVFSIVSTNLSLPLSDGRIDELLLCGLGLICVSLDGATSKTYARYRVGGEFALVVENLTRLVRRKAELGIDLPLIEWRFLVFRHNQHEVPLARQLAREFGVDLLEFFPGSAPRDAGDHQVQRSEPVDLSPSISGPAVDRAFKRTDTMLRRTLRGPDLDGVAPDDLKGQKCDWLYFGAMLFPNGSVGPCCVSNHEPDDFGRIETGVPFHDVWNNEKFREARALFTNPSPSSLICARCPMTDARDYQFRNTVRAILRNAPDWVLWLLAQDPKRFFFDVDATLCPSEIQVIHDRARSFESPLPDTMSRIEVMAASQGASRDAAWLRDRVRGTHSPVLSSSRQQ